MEIQLQILKEHHATILLALKQHLGPSTTFVLDYTRERNNLALLTFANPKNPQAVMAATNQIVQDSNGAITPAILLHKPTDLATNQQDQQWFFYNALRGHRLCLDKTAVPYWPNAHIPERDWEGARSFWLKCEAVADFNVAAAAESQHLDVELIKIALLHESAVQVALGMIRVFLGYTPNVYSLGFLLNLCSHFMEFPSISFPRETQQQQQLYKRICTPPSMLRHWNRLNAPERDFELLLEACRVFLDGAKLLAEHKLE